MSDLTKPPIAPGHVPQSMDARQSYNLVTDTVTGPNVRLKDNLYQAIAIFIVTVVGVVIGLLVTSQRDRIGGAFVGGFVGLVAGLFGSGIFLMIFRAVRHARGRHD